MYPCVGSFGTFGCNGVSPIFGVYPGTYGITGTFGVLGSVGSPGLVGSVGWFGYGSGVGVSSPGLFGTHDPNLVQTTFLSKSVESTLVSTPSTEALSATQPSSFSVGTSAKLLSVLVQSVYSTTVPVTTFTFTLRLKCAVCVTVGFAFGISSPFGVSFLT